MDIVRTTHATHTAHATYTAHTSHTAHATHAAHTRHTAYTAHTALSVTGLLNSGSSTQQMHGRNPVNHYLLYPYAMGSTIVGRRGSSASGLTQLKKGPYHKPGNT